MSWQRGYGEATPGTDARPVNRGRVVTLSQGELSDMLDQAGRKAQRAFKSALVIGTVLGITLGFGATRAFGHGWYSQACCSGKDCAPIAASAVTWTPNGWRVALNPGQHPMVTLAPMVELVRALELRNPFKVIEAAQASLDRSVPQAVKAREALRLMIARAGASEGVAA